MNTVVDYHFRGSAAAGEKTIAFRSHLGYVLPHGDENSAYDELAGLNVIVQNNHSVAFVVDPDASTNQVESHFSRLRRAEIGIHHHIAGKYLDWYAADVAWREDYRRVDFREQSKTVLGSALAKPVSRNMAGYWQHSGKADEALVGWSPLSDLR